MDLPQSSRTKVIDCVVRDSKMKIGWMLVFVVSIIVVVVGLVLFLTGAEPDAQLFQHATGSSWSNFASSGQGIVNYVEGTLRLLGAIVAIAGTFAATITYMAFRKGVRWAFYVLFLIPLALLYTAVDTLLNGGSMWPVYFILLIVDIIGLLLPYKTFFEDSKKLLDSRSPA